MQLKKKNECHNVGNSLDTERFEKAPDTNAPVNFVENVFQESIPSSSQHKCAPSCSGPKSKCPLWDDIEEDNILNTSDQNEIKSDISSELASFDEMMTCNLRYHIYLRMSLHQKLREVRILIYFF